MVELALAVAAFVLIHALPAIPKLRAALVARLGLARYIALYSVVSLAVLIWLASAFTRAVSIELWAQTAATRWVPLLVMPFACILLAGGLWAPNPLSLAVRARGFDPARPGVLGLTRHPLFWGLALWAAAHVAPNGDLAGIVVFAVLAGFSLYGVPALDRRKRAAMGEEAWRAAAAHAPAVLFARPPSGERRFEGPGWAAALIGGAVLYSVFLMGHEYVLGASPWPF